MAGSLVAADALGDDDVGNNLAMVARIMYCWKCSLEHPESAIVCPRCGAANAPGQSNATPPTVGSPRGHDLEVDWTAGHQVGPHWAGGYSLLLVLGLFLLAGIVIGLLTGGLHH